jgi:glycosyl transferase family 25
MINNCLIINMDHRTDLWENISSFRDSWKTAGNVWHRISGTCYANNQSVLNQYIIENRINLNGNGFRINKTSFLGELGCYDSHYNCWKYIVDNNLKSCLIIEDGITVLRTDFKNMKINDHIDLLYVNEEMKTNSNNEYIGYGTQGYILSLNGAKKLLELCATLTSPIDLQLRHICNTKQINASVLNKPFVKRDHNRASSIAGVVLNDQDDLNSKQHPHSIVQRILAKLLEKNINLDEYI